MSANQIIAAIGDWPSPRHYEEDSMHPDLIIDTFADHAATYRAAGWVGTLPLPAGQKFPPPSGYTGDGGIWPSDQDITAWSNRAGDDFNLALRLPEDIIGIDVDAYDDKPGAATLTDAEARWGVLPATYISSARDGVSGIRLYRIPTGLDWPNEVGPGIETVRHGHRYVVASPSINPRTGTAYRWTAPDGSTVDVPDLALRRVSRILTGGSGRPDLCSIDTI